MVDQNQTQKQQSQKKLRTSAPKGSKLAQGYTDRTKAREDEEADDRAVRLKALEEALKKEEIDQATYDNLRIRIAGGDLESTHLVKGLDFKLLERIRKGEDVYDSSSKDDGPEDDEEQEPENVDDAFEELEDATIETVARDAISKKGQMAMGTTLKPGQKRSRAMVLAEMKAAREAAKAKEESTLGLKFKKIGDKTPGSRIEKDSKGREVLIIVDEDGNEKRKVRKVQAQDEVEEAKARELMMPDKDATPLGMEVPEFYRKKADEPEVADVDIFDDVGDDYDPLAGLVEDSAEDSDDDKDDDQDVEKPLIHSTEKEMSAVQSSMLPPPKPIAATGPRNYFEGSKTDLASSQTLQAPSMSDPAIQAAFKRAAALNKRPLEEDEEAKAKAERRKKMLETVDRDAEDLDMGFGTSRFEDEADFDESDVKLSRWGGDGDDDDPSEGSKPKRKKSGKKRKGDVNNADDVMRVLEQRKAAK